ncbi:MAG: trans-sulfuration enzyme family protein [Rhizomicrobium sp.]
MSEDSKPRMQPATVAAQALGWIDEKTRSVSPLIHPSSTFIRDPDNQYRSGRVYARSDNPTYDQAEAVLASLENAKDAALFASGMAAATAVFLSLKPGDHVVAPRMMYWLLRSWLLNFATEWGLRVDLVDMTDLSAVKAAMRPGMTKLIWVETPANPTWDITDLGAVSQIARDAGARLAVDSTVATPVFTRPLDLGADIVMHSATKYLNGHSDLIGGALATRRDDEHWARIKMLRTQLGGVPGAFEAWLLLRGMRTLFPRVRTAAASAQAIAEHFSRHVLVSEVLYPGLKNFAGHANAARQMSGGFGGMLSIRVKGGEGAAIATAAHVRIWKRATSIGGVESLIEHRASAEGPDTPCPRDLLRLSVGVEEVTDLIDDLEAALAYSQR